MNKEVFQMLRDHAVESAEKMRQLFSDLILSLSYETGKEITLPLPNALWPHMDRLIDLFICMCSDHEVDYQFINGTNEVKVNGNIVRFVKLDMNGLA